MSYFSEQMTSKQLMEAFFAAVKGKTEEEVKEIEAEFDQVSEAILDREAKQSESWML